ncbi:MAG: hypothetical protein GF418_04260 [Chitinivibrionales bacterium]|nr:hypothetical protein [Chitinivibrionales bacterium]MBD3394821.1 hypothetical protein [Chitinivibrionales bacterium]
MVGSFKEYIQAQASEILDAVGDDVKCDPDRFRREAIAWIERNAEHFRRRWENRHAE